jgi:hypothetical protein
MTHQLLTKVKAIEYWTEYQRLISVGSYEERSVEHHLTGTWPEDGLEESLFNLENWAAKQGLAFCWNHDSNTWSLVPIEQDDDLRTKGRESHG